MSALKKAKVKVPRTQHTNNSPFDTNDGAVLQDTRPLFHPALKDQQQAIGRAKRSKQRPALFELQVLTDPSNEPHRIIDIGMSNVDRLTHVRAQYLCRFESEGREDCR